MNFGILRVFSIFGYDLLTILIFYGIIFIVLVYLLLIKYASFMPSNAQAQAFAFAFGVFLRPRLYKFLWYLYVNVREYPQVLQYPFE